MLQMMKNFVETNSDFESYLIDPGCCFFLRYLEQCSDGCLMFSDSAVLTVSQGGLL